MFRKFLILRIPTLFLPHIPHSLPLEVPLLLCIGEGNGNPLQHSCLENSRDGRAWWAAVCGDAQSRTRLKRLGSSCFSALPALPQRIFVGKAVLKCKVSNVPFTSG